MSVSYTHLDVYKRQSVDKSEEIFMASKEPQSGCFTITKDNWGYTEIRLRDVYKRQLLTGMLLKESRFLRLWKVRTISR